MYLEYLKTLTSNKYREGQEFHLVNNCRSQAPGHQEYQQVSVLKISWMFDAIEEILMKFPLSELIECDKTESLAPPNNPKTIINGVDTVTGKKRRRKIMPMSVSMELEDSAAKLIKDYSESPRFGNMKRMPTFSREHQNSQGGTGSVFGKEKKGLKEVNLLLSVLKMRNHFRAVYDV